MGHPAVEIAGEPCLLALGNPNTGKTTLVNALSGTDLQIGNWPGTTVERVAASFLHGGRRVSVVDLPGAYSLSATTPEEHVTRTEILELAAEAVINVVDATNLERNLYLTLELTELGLPGVLCLNLVDEARRAGIELDTASLASSVGMPVVRTVATRREGISSLVDQAVACTPPKPCVSYPPAIEEAAHLLEQDIPHRGRRWLALAALSGENVELPPAVVARAAELRNDLTQKGVDPFLEIAGARFARAREIAGGATRRRGGAGISFTERLDRWVLHPVLGVPIFLAGMFLTFRFTFQFSDPWIEFAGLFQEVIAAWIAALGLPELLRSLLADGVVGGLGTVVAFAPVLFFLYLAMSFLESSGFLSRAAFLADRVMKGVGLPGRGFIPLLLGFGCNVPAIYATRTLEGFSERLRVALAIPFMACSARLAVFALFAAVFFPTTGATVVFGLYLGGLAVGLLTAALLSRVTPESATSGVMELPPYRMPGGRLLMKQAVARTMAFIRGAGGAIMAAVLVVWILLNIPPGDLTGSLYGRISSALGLVFAPAGFSDWRLVGALIPGFIAKEVVVGTLGVSFLQSEPTAAMGLMEGLGALASALAAALIATANAVPALFGLPSLVPPPPDAPAALHAALASSTTPAGALAYLTFILLYTPCVATVAAIKQEFGARWAWFTVVYQLVVAYLFALLVYQVGRFLL
ncbi:MAG: ferrous iron transport protein B [Armatimonadetes bacterium]|nr:ferrous iron transport protein B [Armatimonadota bacterium]